MILPIECECGSVAGTVEINHANGYRTICLCDDFQAYAHALKRTDILDANGGTDVFPLTPQANRRIT